MYEFKLPDLGEGVAEGELVRWIVTEGESVVEDQPIAEVETDKALVEIPSPVNGSVAELRAEEGEILPVGSVLVVFDTQESDTVAVTDEPAATPTDDQPAANDTRRDHGSRERVFAPPRVRRLARELGVDLDSIATGDRLTEAEVRAAAEETHVQTTESTNVEQTTALDEEGEPSPSSARGRDRTLAAPSTRRLAKELDVDLNAVPAVEMRDGEAFVTDEAVQAYAEDQPTTGRQAESEAVERIPYRGIRRSIGQQMVHAATTIPHVTHHETVDVSKLVDAREQLKPVAESRGTRLTYLPFVMKAIVLALRDFPTLNASLDEDNEEIIIKHKYHLGVAVATDEGLVVPVVRDVDQKGLLELATDLAELTHQARDRSIGRDAMQGSTFTITNFGAIGGEYATPIINDPNVAILGTGAINRRPWVVDDEVVPRSTLPLSLSIDHRVVDGATAAQFVERLKEPLSNPLQLLLD